MTMTCDILIAGGGVGGVAAALRSTALGCSVILLEENKWLGGQITAQGVSALDEHALIEVFGGTALYYDFRERIRQYYRENYRLSAQALYSAGLNPGSCGRQRRLAFEPAAGAEVIDGMLRPAVKAGCLTVLKPYKAVEVSKEGAKITAVTAKNLKTGRKVRIFAEIFIDATELGDLIALAEAPFSTGMESFAQTHEPSAPRESLPSACQALSYTFAVELCPGESHVTKRPKLYEEMTAKHRFSLNGMNMYEGEEAGMFIKYRQIIDAANFDDPLMRHDVTLINCPSTDYKEDTIIDKPAAAVKKSLYRAKQLALCYLYWLQTKAPRDDGSEGYPELKLRADLMGTADGLSQYPYIRESRRIKGLYTMKEEDVAASYQNGASRARFFHDSVGIGWYRYLDIHWCCNTSKRPGSGHWLLPFQLPMGALLSDAVPNLIAGAKNISATHIANGALRFHPIEWNSGESAGALAAYCADAKQMPQAVYHSKDDLRRFQLMLLAAGIPLYWFDDVPIGHKAFVAVQYLTLSGIISGAGQHLHFCPDETAGKAITAQWLKRIRHRFRLQKSAVAELEQAQGWTKARFAEELFLKIRDIPLE